MGVALAFEDGTTEFTNDLQKVRSLAENPDNLIVCHNIKFDYHALLSEGIRIARGACTLAMAKLIDENRFDYSLDTLSRELLGDHKDDELIKIWSKNLGWGSIPWPILSPYAQKDAELCLKLAQRFIPKCNSELVDREFKFMQVVAEMEQLGIETDPKLIQDKITQGEQRMKEIEDELGFDPKKPSLLGKYLFEQLGLPVLSRTKTGRPSLDKKTMELYEEQFLQGLPILEYRGWQKAISSYYQKLVDLGPRIHPDFQLQGTVTGRLSCKNPNLQQIPRSGTNPWQVGTKQAFIPRPYYELIEIDYSQLEFRLCAAYAQETSLLREFSKPTGDVFSAMASQLSLPRQQVKTLTYSVLYGAGVRRIATVFNVSQQQAGALRDRFYNTYKGIFTLSNQTAIAAAQRGYIKLWTGKERHLTSGESYKAMNSLIQGGAAELVKEAMLKINDQLVGEDCRMLLQIHDAIVFEIRDDLVGAYLPKLIEVMTSFPQFPVTFAVDAHYFRTGEKINEPVKDTVGI